MLKWLRVVCAVAAAAAATPASATVLTFKDAGETGWLNKVADGYGGLNWTGLNLITEELYDRVWDGTRLLAPVRTGITSGTHGAISDDEGFAPKIWTDWTKDGYFSFNAVKLTSALEPITLQVEGYQIDEGVPDYVRQITIFPTRARTFVANWHGVTTVRFQVVRGDHRSFLLDDLQINETYRVPEPTALGLLGLGLTGVAAARRRKAA